MLAGRLQEKGESMITRRPSDLASILGSDQLPTVYFTDAPVPSMGPIGPADYALAVCSVADSRVKFMLEP